jgi:hypothetical protein|tara:strand:- start:70 stop:558 length:489 start_codon:yes stop_codon:yes gene_type:complete
MFNIHKNFLEQETLQNIKKEIKGMHWFFLNFTADKNDKSNFLFYHLIFENNKVQSNRYFNTILMPILGKLNFKYLHRAKLNLYTKKDKQIKTNYHIDCDIEHTVALFSLNTNNGYTEFEDGKKIKSEENNLVIFPGHLKHRSVNQTDENTRINLNINLKNVI